MPSGLILFAGTRDHDAADLESIVDHRQGD